MVARCRRARVLAVAAGLATLLGGPATAGARGFSASVPRGGIVLPVGARDLGTVAASALVRATVALTPRDPRALSDYATAVTTPSSRDYHHYLTVAQFARRFAPTPAQRRLVRSALRARGLAVGATSPNGLSITVRASAGTTAAAFATAIDRFALPGGATTEAPTLTPRLGGAAGRIVQGVVGLNTIAPSPSVIVRGRRSAGAAADAVGRTTSTSPGPEPCGAARSAAAGQGGFTADQIAARYGLSNFYAAGDEGRGVTVALYELEPFSAADVAAYQACMGTSATVVTEPIDGGAGSGSGSGEAASDIEDLIGLVPRATVRVYEGPQSGQGAYDTYSAIVADDAANVVSTSWGLCEAQLGASAARAEDVLFQEAAAQGQSVVAASGDNGADDCSNGTRAVDDPASQPWVTGVGGTSVHGATDTVWDDSFGAGGGGASQLWARPAWQTAAIAQSAATCGSAGSACREVPDLSAEADPASGYAAYYRGAWRVVGGTSVAAPTVAALAALADASPACGGHPLGFLSPALYAHAADFSDVTAGTNSFGGVLGFAAGPGYDLASGLGAPTAALGPALCGDALSLAAPAAQSWTTGRGVTLSAHATSVKGAAITWSATGLPAGLSIDPGNGLITGTPTAAARSTIVLRALDADGASATASFAATVTAAPATTAGSARRGGSSVAVDTQRLKPISAWVGRALRVHLRVHLRARGALRGAVRYSARGLPRGLHVGPSSGVLRGTPRAAGRASVTIRVTRATGLVATARLRVVVLARAPQAHHRGRGSRRRRR